MAQFKPDESSFSSLKGQVAVIAGGATGIGAATVKILAQSGAKVVVGDINTASGQELAQQVDGVTFVHCDVTKYDNIYELFRTAHDKHGVVHHAIPCAGIIEQGNWFDPDLTIESVKNDSGNTKVIDINVMGVLHFARIAAVFLRDGIKKGEENRSLTLLSSVNAFRESPGLFLYQTSKHAIQGLLRSSRKTLYERDGIRVNAVCPGVTDTPMTTRIINTFKENDLCWQPAEAVAKIIVGLVTTTSMNGKAMYVESSEGWEFEDGLYKTQSLWLGEEATKKMRKNAEAVMRVSRFK
ncbi:NAD(P)-binding protein [Rhizodiscina lignyota]|uniref:NAD(P)-binding protein n=1 Tax=Rhizodiscina lignyota TaxID=1504668 RepID=A0A9P4IVM0_9PEZI|nr:NAD(P)-binding protein [Rhizodiscina lignyota]